MLGVGLQEEQGGVCGMGTQGWHRSWLCCGKDTFPGQVQRSKAGTGSGSLHGVGLVLLVRQGRDALASLSTTAWPWESWHSGQEGSSALFGSPQALR